jgi:hypothetical protein
VIPAFWSDPLPTYLWQVALHSWVLGLTFYVWAHRVRLPSGRTKRFLLALVLLLPMLTAAIPGRASVEFGERVAWLNSARVLAVPLLGGLRLYHVILLVGLLTMALTIWQELLPSLGRTQRSTLKAPDNLLALVHAYPGWERCRVIVSPLDSIMLATGGRPGRPKLIVSRGAIASFTGTELETVVAHEQAHWRPGRWLRSHALFVVRLLQFYNPVALWAFREYCVEVEIDCDAIAVSGRDPHVLARVLLKIYQTIDRGDVAARSAMRKRVDVLLGGGPQDASLSTFTILGATAVMLMVLPWIV